MYGWECKWPQGRDNIEKFKVQAARLARGLSRGNTRLQWWKRQSELKNEHETLAAG